ncbi:MAG: hypothetical protein ACI88A_003407 [Paraglaciecola sp.]|jgi:hypothetical protein
MSELVPTSGAFTLSTILAQVSFSMDKKTSRLQPINLGLLITDGREVLPDIVINWVQNAAGEVISDQRHLILSENPYWDYFVGVKVVWPLLPGKQIRRISMPLSLVEKNENGVHNCVLVFETDKTTAQQRFYYQISSETCAYFKADFWGTETAIDRLGSI